MQFILLFGVMLILHVPCLFVLLRLAVRSRESEDHPGTWNVESQASYALDHSFFYLIMLVVNHCDMLRLI
jgi:predicted secreted protein